MTFLGRQVHNLLRDFGGRDLVLGAISVLGVIATIALLRELIKLKFRIHPIVFGCLLSLGVIGGVLLEIPEERLHIVKYGGLGFLTQALAHRHGLPVWYALGFASFFSIFDEIIQHFLPYRVGDLRDVALNIVSSVWGIALIKLSVRKNA